MLTEAEQLFASASDLSWPQLLPAAYITVTTIHFVHLISKLNTATI